MQILPSTGEELAGELGVTWLGPQTLFDPFVNVRLGVAYLKELTERYGNTSSALAAYNWGPGHIDRRIRRGVPLPKAYPALVMEAYSAHAARRSCWIPVRRRSRRTTPSLGFASLRAPLPGTVGGDVFVFPL